MQTDTIASETAELRVRPIEAQDRHPLIAMVHSIPQFKPEEAAVAARLIDASIDVDLEQSGNYQSLVATRGSALLGYVNFGRTPMTQATWDLYWIAVAPKAQGHGVGKQLLLALCQTIAARGGRQVRIETSSQESYASTNAFYQRHGFSIVGRLPDFYSPGDDLLIYYRTLDASDSNSESESPKTC